MNDLNLSVELLDIIARKFGYDGIQLWQKLGSNNKLMTYAVFCSFGNTKFNYTTVVLANKEIIYVNYYTKASNRYAELVKTLYKTLDGNGTISDGVTSLDARAFPEFMIDCALNGYV